MSHGFADTPLPAGGQHGFSGEYHGPARLDPVSETQAIHHDTDAVRAETGPTPAQAERVGKGTPVAATLAAIEAFAYPRGRLLMSYENPEGHKLEDLADQLSRELLEKSAKLGDAVLQVGQKGEAARTAVNNNGVIIGLLQKIKSIQLDTMAAFAEIGPDQGPGGTPRVDARDLRLGTVRASGDADARA